MSRKKLSLLSVFTIGIKLLISSLITHLVRIGGIILNAWLERILSRIGNINSWIGTARICSPSKNKVNNFFYQLDRSFYTSRASSLGPSGSSPWIPGIWEGSFPGPLSCEDRQSYWSWLHPKQGTEGVRSRNSTSCQGYLQRISDRGLFSWCLEGLTAEPNP